MGEKPMMLFYRYVDNSKNTDTNTNSVFEGVHDSFTLGYSTSYNYDLTNDFVTNVIYN